MTELESNYAPTCKLDMYDLRHSRKLHRRKTSFRRRTSVPTHGGLPLLFPPSSLRESVSQPIELLVRDISDSRRSSVVQRAGLMSMEAGKAGTDAFEVIELPHDCFQIGPEVGFDGALNLHTSRHSRFHENLLLERNGRWKRSLPFDTSTTLLPPPPASSIRVPSTSISPSPSPAKPFFPLSIMAPEVSKSLPLSSDISR